MAKNSGRDLSVLDKRERKAAETTIVPGDHVCFVLKSVGGQGLVALKDRVLVVKSGFMSGATFGGRVTTIPLADISAIQVNKGMVNATIEILAAGYGAHKAGDFFSMGDRDDPWKLPNTLPASKQLLKEFEPYLAELRTMVSMAKNVRTHATLPPPPAPTLPSTVPSRDLASQLERLVQLHAQGLLSDEEFSAAKSRLLAS